MLSYSGFCLFGLLIIGKAKAMPENKKARKAFNRKVLQASNNL
jgi:hypothetical protein